jgi:hypothetical protein
LHPLTVVEHSLRSTQRQSGPDLLGGGFGLDGLIEEALGLAPRAPRLSGHTARIVSLLFGVLDFGFSLGRVFSRSLGLPPCVVQDELELVLGMKDIETHRERSCGDHLVLLMLRLARFMGQLHAPRQALPRIRDDPLHRGPMRS